MRTLGEDSQVFVRKGFTEDLLDFGRGFARLWEMICKDLHETLGEDSQGFGRFWEQDLQGFHETLGEDSQVFARICKRICEDSQGIA